MDIGFEQEAAEVTDVPRWIEQDIEGEQIESIQEGGCASGAYMPAVTYYNARQVMAEHGDDVLQYIEDHYGELPAVPTGESWSGISVFFLSVAVELWVGQFAVGW
jgi:hypothetical protein